MNKRLSFAAGASMLLMLSAAVSCVEESVTAPPPASPTSVPERTTGDRTVAADARADVERQIAAINYLTSERGFEQMLRHGVDPVLVASRRQQAESDLVDLRARLQQIEKGDVSGLSLSVSPGTDLPLCLLNATVNINACILSAYMTIDVGGSGTVTTNASTAVSHSTSTVIIDNLTTDLGTKNTSAFLNAPYYHNTFSFAAPNCFTADHDVVGRTNHHISVSLLEVSSSGDKPSTDHSVCFRKYLTVSLSSSSISVGSTSTVTVGHLPSSGCAYSISSSNTDVATIMDGGNNIWGATGLQAGTATITARCPDGTSGSSTLTVIDPITPPPPGGGPVLPPPDFTPYTPPPSPTTWCWTELVEQQVYSTWGLQVVVVPVESCITW